MRTSGERTERFARPPVAGLDQQADPQDPGDRPGLLETAGLGQDRIDHGEGTGGVAPSAFDPGEAEVDVRTERIVARFDEEGAGFGEHLLRLVEVAFEDGLGGQDRE